MKHPSLRWQMHAINSKSGSRKRKVLFGVSHKFASFLFLLATVPLPWLVRRTYEVLMTTTTTLRRDRSVVATSLTSFATSTSVASVPLSRSLTDLAESVTQQDQQRSDGTESTESKLSSVRLVKEPVDSHVSSVDTTFPTHHKGDSCYANASAHHEELQLPSFIIAGAQKSGTTALFMMLRQHFQLVSTAKIEAHFFDRLPAVWNASFEIQTDSASLTRDQICSLRNEYRAAFDARRLQNRQRRLRAATAPTSKNITHRLVTFEKTPIYLCLSRVPEYVHRIAPWAKIVIVLRNPIDRALSHFRMQQTAAQIFTNHGGNIERVGGNAAFRTSFDDMVTDEIRLLQSLNLTRAPGLALYKYATQRNDVTEEQMQPLCHKRRNMSCTFQMALPLRQRLDHMKALFANTRDRRRIQCGGLARGLYAEQLAPWLRYFTLNETILVVRYERFLEDRSAVLSEILKFVGAMPFPEHVLTQNKTPSMIGQGVASFLHTSYSPYTKQQTKTNEPLHNVTRDYLQKFYKPYNDELTDLLGDDWRDVWD